MANLLRPHEDQVRRLAEVPGLGPAQQVIAEVGATAATFPSEKHLSSWVAHVLVHFRALCMSESAASDTRRVPGVEPSLPEANQDGATRWHPSTSGLSNKSAPEK